MAERRLALLIVMALLAGCGGQGGRQAAEENAEAPRSALERAAIQAGIVPDVAVLSPAGLYRHVHEAGRDSLCILPGKSAEEPMRFGLEAAFGEHVDCHGQGTLRRSGDKLIMNFARSACLIVARYEGDQVSLPGAVDVECNRLCSERGSLEGVSFPRVSRDASVAAAAKNGKGETLCPS